MKGAHIFLFPMRHFCSKVTRFSQTLNLVSGQTGDRADVLRGQPLQLHGKRSFALHLRTTLRTTFGAPLRTALRTTFGPALGTPLRATFLNTFRLAIKPGGVNLVVEAAAI